MKPILVLIIILLLTLTNTYGAKVCPPSQTSDTVIVPIYTVTFRELVKNRETMKAQIEVIAAKDSALMAYQQKQFVADSLRMEFEFQKRIHAVIDTQQLEKESILQETIDNLTAQIKRMKLGPWLGFAGGVVVTTLLVMLVQK